MDGRACKSRVQKRVMMAAMEARTTPNGFVGLRECLVRRVGVAREDDDQIAAPTETRTGIERISLTKACAYKDGDRGGLAEWEQIHGKKTKVCLAINRPSEKRVKTGDAGGRPS